MVKKIHFDRGNRWWNHQPQMWMGNKPEYTTDIKKVTCQICLRMMHLKDSPNRVTAEMLHGIRTKATPEEDSRYKARRAQMLKLQEKYREDNCRIIDGLSDEEMDKLREMMPSLRRKKDDD
jgi:hypothetical protein